MKRSIAPPTPDTRPRTSTGHVLSINPTRTEVIIEPADECFSVPVEEIETFCLAEGVRCTWRVVSVQSFEVKVPRMGVTVECPACGRRKAPYGRSIPMVAHGSYCERESCAHYDDDPKPDTLWPGEVYP